MNNNQKKLALIMIILAVVIIGMKIYYLKVNKNQITKENQNETAIFIVSRFNVDLYKEPKTSSQVIVRLFRGDKLILLKEFENDKINPELINKYKWYFVEKTESEKGWLKGENIDNVKENESELLELLKVSTDENRGNIIYKLGLLKSEKAKNSIIEIYNSGCEYACLDALGTYRDKNLIPIFVKELRKNNLNEIDSIYALGNYLDKDVVEYLKPYLDNDNIFLKKAAFQVLNRFDDEEINNLLNSKRINFTEILEDLHRAYQEQNIKYISKHLDKENGFYLSLIDEGGIYSFRKKLTTNEAIEFYQGESKDSKMKSEFFSIKNITDIKVKNIYYYPEFLILNESNNVEFVEFMNTGTVFGDHPISNYDKNIMILVEWTGFRKNEISEREYHYGAYLNLIQRGDNWYIVGFEQAYQ